MPALKGSKTEENLKTAFAGESQANRRYLYFAQKADVEGYPDVAALFRSVAEGETGHAFGHFDFLREVGDPVTGVPVGAIVPQRVTSRPIATCRCATGTRSPATASAIGKIPPAVMPAITRNAIRVSKFIASPQASVVTPTISMQIVISRVLLNMSASAPSSGCTSA